MSDQFTRANFTLPSEILDTFRDRCNAVGAPMSAVISQLIAKASDKVIAENVSSTARPKRK